MTMVRGLAILGLATLLSACAAGGEPVLEPPPAPMAPAPEPMPAPPPPSMPVSAPASPPPAGRPGPGPRAGTLTAADHDDLLNPAWYARYVTDYLQKRPAGLPYVDTRRVVRVVVTGSDGRPAPFAAVTLRRADGSSKLLKTVADGTVVLFPALDRTGESFDLLVSAPGSPEELRKVSLAGLPGDQSVRFRLKRPATAVRQVDLFVTLDATGSMSDEMDYLKAELTEIVARLKRVHAGIDLRIGLVVYRDVGDEYVVRAFGFNGDVQAIQASLAQQSANGGGDYPEAVDQALAASLDQQWREEAVKILLFVADAPPHDEKVQATWATVGAARDRRIQIVPVAASGVGDKAEFLMRAMAAVTQSRYLFLTDDSGVGLPHATPEVACYQVTRLDTLVGRVLQSLIAGTRVEPEPQEVIRTVGSYDKGRCGPHPSPAPAPE